MITLNDADRRVLETLTDKERDVLLAIGDSEYGDGPGTAVWSNCINSSWPAKSLGGIVASLDKKGLVHAWRDRDPRESTITMTYAGFVAYQKSGGTRQWAGGDAR